MSKDYLKTESDNGSTATPLDMADRGLMRRMGDLVNPNVPRPIKYIIEKALPQSRRYQTKKEDRHCQSTEDLKPLRTSSMGLVDTGVTDDFSLDKFHHNSQCPISDVHSQISGNNRLNRVSS